MSFSQLLLAWYHQHQRDLPWRQTKDPYTIWVSEIILQQTRVDQGLQYFYRFLEAFPRVHDLAQAPLEQLLHVWQGLGYYSRARNMHLSARQIVEEAGGEMPVTYQQWLAIKGVGPYTAAAIASIVSNQPVPALDGNACRVIGRVFALQHDYESAAGKKAFFEMAESLIDHSCPGDFNQALMDLGALVCKPAGPLCHQCPLSIQCMAFQQDRILQYPIRKKKAPPRDRHFNYFLVLESGTSDFWVKKRQRDDIWKELYELPLVETPQAVSPAAILQHLPPFLDHEKPHFSIQGNPLRLNHQLTHQTIRASFYVVKVFSSKNLNFGHDLIRVSADDFENMPKSRLMQRFFGQPVIIRLLNHDSL